MDLYQIIVASILVAQFLVSLGIFLLLVLLYPRLAGGVATYSYMFDGRYMPTEGYQYPEAGGDDVA